jgi:hypothetical protein
MHARMIVCRRVWFMQVSLSSPMAFELVRITSACMYVHVYA